MIMDEENVSFDVEHMIVKKGKNEMRLIVLNEYQYRFHIFNKGKEFWRCRKRFCKERITVFEGKVIKFSKARHNHPPPNPESAKSRKNNSVNSDVTVSSEVDLLENTSSQHRQMNQSEYYLDNESYVIDDDNHSNYHQPSYPNSNQNYSSTQIQTVSYSSIQNNANSSIDVSLSKNQSSRNNEGNQSSSHEQSSYSYSSFPQQKRQHSFISTSKMSSNSKRSDSSKKFQITRSFPGLNLFSKYAVEVPKMILFGDSLTQRSFDPTSGCWGAYFANKFQRIIDVIPRGFSGYNTRWMKEIIDPVFSEFNSNYIACVVIWLGANDANESNSCSGQQVPINEYSQNLRYFIDYLESIEIPKNRLILATPPPYNHKQFALSCIPGEIPAKSSQLTERYARECAKVAQDCGVTLADVHGAFKAHPNCEQYFQDGLHFNKLGGEMVYKFFDKFITEKIELFKGQKFNPNDMLFPYWKEIVSHQRKTNEEKLM